MIPYSRQSINDDDINEVIKVLKSDLITQGPIVQKFAKTICTYTSSNYSVLTNSATSALHIACLSLGLGKGDILWTSPNSYVASANVGLLCNAEIDFVDIDPFNYNICIHALSDKLKNAEKYGKLPKIVMPVHFAGQSCDMKAIKKLSKKYGFNIIEDASHAIGGSYNGTKIGSCRFSDITVFSFHPVKIITTAEGGIVTTNSNKIYKKLKILRSLGIKRNINKHWIYDIEGYGLNFRLNDIQCALGVSQLKKIKLFISKRKKLYNIYKNNLGEIKGLSFPDYSKNNLSAYHLCLMSIDKKDFKIKEKFIKYILKKKIIVQYHYIPIYKFKIFSDKYLSSGAEKYFKSVVSLPIFYGLSFKKQNQIINFINNFFK